MQVIGMGKYTCITLRHVHIRGICLGFDVAFFIKNQKHEETLRVRVCLTTSTCDFDDSVGALRRRKKKKVNFSSSISLGQKHFKSRWSDICNHSLGLCAWLRSLQEHLWFLCPAVPFFFFFFLLYLI